MILNIKKVISAALLPPLFLTGFLAFAAGDSREEKTDFNSYIQTVYSSTNGLSCGEANDVAQTPDGILWIGTYAGLYRYNGSEFRWVKDFTSVRNVNCLHTDNAGRLWIGSNDKGISVCMNERIVYTLGAEEGLPSNTVRAIVQGADNLYYVATAGGMVIITLEADTLRILTKLDEVGYASSLAADRNGNVAVVSADGTLRLIHDRKVLLQAQSSVSTEMFTCCAFDRNGVLYTGSSHNHIQAFDLDIGNRELLPKGQRECGALSNAKRLCFTADKLFICADNGIGYLDTRGDYYAINTGDFNNSIDSMVEDYQGNYWFTSSRKGLLRLSTSTFINIYTSLGMKGRVVNTVTEWQDLLYIGADNGLDAVDMKKKQAVQNALTQRFAGLRIRCLQAGKGGSLWIASYGKGLFEVTESGNIISYDSAGGSQGRDCGDRVRTVLELEDGVVAAAHNKGISFIQNHRVFAQLTAKELGKSAVLNLLETESGIIYAGTNGDGIVVISKNGIIKKFTTEDGLTSGVILRIVKDGRGGAFIVTSNSLCHLPKADGRSDYRPEDKDYRIRELKNFPYYNNYDIISDNESATGSLFVLGSAGIYVVQADDLLGNDEISYELLDAKSGLNSSLTANAWNWHDSKGNLYLASDSGVFKVNMFSYREKQKSYRMHISQIRLDNQDYQLEAYKPVMISRSTQKIEIIPEIINYTSVEPYVSYKLEGFDSKWTKLPTRELSSIVYTNLPPGNYTLRLALLDGKLGNTLDEVRCILLKQKALYDMLAFRIALAVLALLLAVAATFLVQRAKMRRTLARQQEELERAREQARMGNETVFAIAKTVDAKDENTSQHSSRVAEYSVMIAKELGFSQEECENLRKAALLHDIGKIGIPDRILNKPARLTDEEYAVMKSHVTRGSEILKDFTMIDHLSDGVLYHHERYDGTGYGQGLKGEDIPLYGRIIGVADAFDAMTANRVYRKRQPFQYVVDELHRCRGTQFDPQITDIMLKLIENGTIQLKEAYSNEN